MQKHGAPQWMQTRTALKVSLNDPKELHNYSGNKSMWLSSHGSRAEYVTRAVSKWPSPCGRQSLWKDKNKNVLLWKIQTILLKYSSNHSNCLEFLLTKDFFRKKYFITGVVSHEENKKDQLLPVLLYADNTTSCSLHPGLAAPATHC